MTPDVLPLAAIVKARREQLALSLRGLDKLSGVSYSTIANIEAGKTKRPGEDVLRGLAAGLDMPVSKLREAANVPTTWDGVPSAGEGAGVDGEAAEGGPCPG
jgi:transcriptional regulator with XRE-family HTH domain